MNIIKNANKAEIYNDGILIIEVSSLEQIRDIAIALLKGNIDIREVKLLNKILHVVNVSLSTQEVA